MKGHVKHDEIKPYNYIDKIKEFDITTYLKHDCCGLLESMIKYWIHLFETYGVDIFKKGSPISTTASLAFNVFRTNFYDEKNHKIYIPSKEQNEYARLAYWGGSTVIFWRGRFVNLRVRSVDINSSYPYQMTWPLPCGPYYFNIFGFKFEGQNIQEGIYQIIIISTPELDSYFLCDRSGDTVIASKFSKYLLYVTAEEIRYAYELGYEMFLIDGWTVNELRNPFYEYVTSLYAKRQEYKKKMKDELRKNEELRK